MDEKFVDKKQLQEFLAEKLKEENFQGMGSEPTSLVENAVDDFNEKFKKSEEELAKKVAKAKKRKEDDCCIGSGCCW